MLAGVMARDEFREAGASRVPALIVLRSWRPFDAPGHWCGEIVETGVACYGAAAAGRVKIRVAQPVGSLLLDGEGAPQSPSADV